MLFRSNNPIFNRSEQFNGTAQTPAYADQTTGDPSTWGTGVPGQTVVGESMTIDSVVQKTAISIGVVIATAIATWFVTGDLKPNGVDVDSAALGKLVTALMVGSLGAFALSMVNSFKRVISPPLVIAFAVLEGVALGALSKLIDAQYGGESHLILNAVMGTFAAFAGTLAAYKYFNIQVGSKFRKFVTAAVFGMIGLSLLEFGLSFFGNQIGLFGITGLGMVTAFAGVALGVFMLIMDFDFVERGVAARLDDRESWRAAFALTVSLVWIYTNLLRIMAFFSND